jgi:biopolymer transport protein ExbD
MKRHRRDLEVISAINITNLLDTAFILLIAFMLVAPTLKSGIPVDLPQVESSESVADEEESHTITIAPRDAESVGDRIYLDGRIVRLEDLRGPMEAAYRANPKVAVTVESDGQALWETVAQVVSIVRSVGIENFVFSTEPRPPRLSGEGKRGR